MRRWILGSWVVFCCLLVVSTAQAQVLPSAGTPTRVEQQAQAPWLALELQSGGVLQDFDGDLRPLPGVIGGLGLVLEPTERLAINANYTTLGNGWALGARFLLLKSERLRLGPSLGAMGFPRAGFLGIYPYLGLAWSWWPNDWLGFDAHLPLLHFTQIGADHALLARLLWPGYVGVFPISLGLLNLRFSESWSGRLSIEGFSTLGPGIFARATWQIPGTPLELDMGLFGMAVAFYRLGAQVGLRWRI